MGQRRHVARGGAGEALLLDLTFTFLDPHVSFLDALGPYVFGILRRGSLCFLFFAFLAWILMFFGSLDFNSWDSPGISPFNQQEVCYWVCIFRLSLVGSSYFLLASKQFNFAK